MKTQTKASGEWTVLWWTVWISVTIGTFFIASWIWTPLIAKWVGPMSNPKSPIIWMIAVFGTWMIFLLPLIMLMYNKVDKAYDDSRAAKQAKQTELFKMAAPMRLQFVAEDRRLLSEAIVKQIKKIPSAIKRGHLLRLTFTDGSTVPYVFVLDSMEVIGVYDRENFDLDLTKVSAVHAENLDQLPEFDYARWLRLDIENSKGGAS